MLFLMVPITSSNSIDKWVILGKKVDFSQFSPKVFNMFDSRFLLIPPKCSFMIQYITAVSALQNDTSFAFQLLCKLSQLTVLSENLQFEMNSADFWRKLIKGLYKPKLNIKTCFYSNLMCSFVWKHLFVCQVKIFVMFLGKIPYLIKKPYIKRFDSTISSIANLEMLLHLNFHSWFLYLGHFRTILAWLPLWQP